MRLSRLSGGTPGAACSTGQQRPRLLISQPRRAPLSGDAGLSPEAASRSFAAKTRKPRGLPRLQPPLLPGAGPGPPRVPPCARLCWPRPRPSRVGDCGWRVAPGRWRVAPGRRRVAVAGRGAPLRPARPLPPRRSGAPAARQLPRDPAGARGRHGHVTLRLSPLKSRLQSMCGRSMQQPSRRSVLRSRPPPPPPPLPPPPIDALRAPAAILGAERGRQKEGSVGTAAAPLRAGLGLRAPRRALPAAAAAAARGRRSRPQPLPPARCGRRAPAKQSPPSFSPAAPRPRPR